MSLCCRGRLPPARGAECPSLFWSGEGFGAPDRMKLGTSMSLFVLCKPFGVNGRSLPHGCHWEAAAPASAPAHDGFICSDAALVMCASTAAKTCSAAARAPSKGPRSSPAGLCEGAKAEPLDQGAARFYRQSRQDGDGPGFRHRRQRTAAREDRASGEVTTAARAEVTPGRICVPLLRQMAIVAFTMAALSMSPAHVADDARPADGSVLPFPPVPT